MRTIKKALLLAGMAVAAMAFAVPAVASAAYWQSNGKPVRQPVVIKVDGNVNYETSGSGLTCPVHGEATLLPGDGGEVTALAIEDSGCHGSGGWAYCAVESTETSAPWPMQAQANGEILISGFSYALSFTPGCFQGSWEVASEEVIATPNNPASISSLVLGGPIEMGPPGNLLIPQEMHGELKITPAGEYGIHLG